MKIAIFSPYATVAPHFETELELAQRHLDQGDEVEYLSCQGALSNCISNPQGCQIRCSECSSRRFPGVELLSPSVRHRELRCDKLKSDTIPDQFHSVSEVIAYQVDNFDIGYAALSSLISIIRDPEPDFGEHSPMLHRFMKSALATYEYTLDYLRNTPTDRVYVFNGRFASMRAVLRACEKLDVDCWIHERGCDNAHYELFENHMPHEINALHQRIETIWN